jgi:hypothetical protein
MFEEVGGLPEDCDLFTCILDVASISGSAYIRLGRLARSASAEMKGRVGERIVGPTD